MQKLTAKCLSSRAKEGNEGKTIMAGVDDDGPGDDGPSEV